MAREGGRGVVAPCRCPAAGFSLLELQISVLLAAFVFASLSVSMTSQAQQLNWIETAQVAHSSGTAAPFGVVAVQSQAISTAADLTGVYYVEVQAVTLSGGVLTATLVRRAAAATDCGRQ